MKTVPQIMAMICQHRDLCLSYHEDNDLIYAEDCEVAYDAIQADLATLHALASLKAQELREELAGLERLRDATSEPEITRASRAIDAQYVGTAWTKGEGSRYRLNALGLARIAEIRRMIGEETNASATEE